MDEKMMIENNRLIADFLGYKICNCGKGDPHYKTGNANWEIIKFQELNYHRSWDQLMPVVKKIRSEDCKFPLPYNYSRINNFLKEVDIEASWIAIVHFIKWYNENQRKT